MGSWGARGVDRDDVGSETEQQDTTEANVFGSDESETPESAKVRLPDLAFGSPTHAHAPEPAAAYDVDDRGADARVATGETALSSEFLALSGRLDELSSALASQSEAIARFHERSAAQEEIITRLHDRVQTLQAGETRHLLKPVVGGLVSLYGEILTQTRGIRRDLSLQETHDLLGVLAARVENTLAALGVEAYGVGVGDPFNPRRHQAVDVIPTDRSEQHETVAALLRPGFEDPTEERAMFVAQVTVSKYVETETETTSDPEADAQDGSGSANLQFTPDSGVSKASQPTAAEHEEKPQ